MSETKTNLSLGLADLKACAQIISVCSQRGAFKAEELSGVGALFEKITMFVNAAEAQAQAAQEQTQEQPVQQQAEKTQDTVSKKKEKS